MFVRVRVFASACLLAGVFVYVIARIFVRVCVFCVWACVLQFAGARVWAWACVNAGVCARERV